MNRIIHTLSTSRTAIILLLATLLTATAAQTAGAQDAITGLTYNSTGGYYEISDAQDLVDLANYVNATENISSGKTFKQTQDIDMSSISNFTPIGELGGDYSFAGTYDGGGHTISGLTVSINYGDIGLFGVVKGATVSNVILLSPTVTATTTKNYSVNLGALIGMCGSGSSNRVENCHVVNPTVSSSSTGSNHVVAIIGNIWDKNTTATNCYYYGGNATAACGYIESGAPVTNVCAAHLVTPADGVTIQTPMAADLGFSCDADNNGTAENYWRTGAQLTLSDHEGYTIGYTVNGTAIDGNTFTMPDENVTIAATFTPDPAHFSQSGDEYTIHTAAGWGVFCDLLAENAFGYFTGKTVALDADITVTRMAGGSGHEFTGTFDGDGKTLTVNYTNNSNDVRTAPFSYVNGATIQNLIVGGSISGTAYRAAGIVGETTGQTTITNCVSSVDISSGRYIGGISIGGLVTITGCVFNGKIVGTTYSGGFVGYSNTATAISNSLFAPQDGSSISGGTFYYNGGGDITPTNSYYTSALGTPQGKATHTVAAGTDVTIVAIALTGTATQYTVSGITAYSGGGLQLGQTLYYGSGDQLSLTLSNTATGAPLGYQYGYTASAGTLSGTTLTMPDQDVTISVNTAALATIDWATVNQGNSADPYMIYNKDQLLLLAHRVNGTNGETVVEDGYSGMYFKLGADITFSHDAVEGDDYAENYVAIGGYYNGYHYFKGNFDGDGHTVSGIRINKDGSGIAYNRVGLFGQIDTGANIHDVHLTDARIKGCYYVGGIVGYTMGTVSGCSVTDSYITATGGTDYGAICGYKSTGFYAATLTNNYYHGCTVNGTAVTSGAGCGIEDKIAADLDDEDNNHGALPAYAITLGANITTPPGTFAGQTEWLTTPPVNPRLAPENGFTLAGNHYFASGYEFTPGSTLASGAAQGYTPRATLGDELLDPYTPTGDAPDYTGTAIARLTITADCDGKTLASTQAIYSTGKPVTVAYIKADGTAGEASAIALDGTETSLAAGTYFAGLENVNFDHTLTLTADATLILADGCTMSINPATPGKGIDGYNDPDEDASLTIYGQTQGSGTLAIATTGVAGPNGWDGTLGHAIHVKDYTQHSGTVTLRTSGAHAEGLTANGNVTINGGTADITAAATASNGINSGGHVTISGGRVTANAADDDFDGILVMGDVTWEGEKLVYIPKNVTITGGIVDASSIAAYRGGDITLGWTSPADCITVGDYKLDDGDDASPDGSVKIADGQALRAPSGTIYTGTLGREQIAAINGRELTPICLLTESDGVSKLAGQTDVPVIFTRSGLTANAYSTMCLPFGFEKPNNCTFYEFKGVGWSTANNQWEATISVTSTLVAHTPYIFKCSDTEATFTGTIANVPDNIEASLVEVGASEGDDTNWMFKGTYTALDWTSADPTEPTYGFSTYVPVEQGNTENIAAGTFVRFVQGASLAPFRARLIYSGSDTHLNARAHSRAAQAEGELPRYIIVRIIGADGTATAIGTLDTATGQLSTDGWYTLGGRRLEAKPTAKGIYIHNGKKVAIK